MHTPITFIIFNRPDTTEQVFAEIAKAKPPKLFVVADGPRTDHPDDIERCAAARAIIERVDWECEVFKNYSEVNLGCGYRPATGISWVFEHVEEAIILEDDCVPHPTFFRFCEELLEKYRDDGTVVQVSGFNPLYGSHKPEYSYFFYRIFACWGWATWRRVWKFQDMKIKPWPELRDTSWLQETIGDFRGIEYFKKIFDNVYVNPANTDIWDHQFLFTCWVRNGLAICPGSNLVDNVGFRADATHTKASQPVKHRVTGMNFPLRHPPKVVWDREADKLRVEQCIGQRTLPLYRRMRQKLSRIMESLL